MPKIKKSLDEQKIKLYIIWIWSKRGSFIPLETDYFGQTTYKTYNSFVKGEFSENPIWISDKKFYPKLPEDKEWSIWQYSSRGRVAGIDGFTDKNTLNEGTIDEFIEKNRIK